MVRGPYPAHLAFLSGLANTAGSGPFPCVHVFLRSSKMCKIYDVALMLKSLETPDLMGQFSTWKNLRENNMAAAPKQE